MNRESCKHTACNIPLSIAELQNTFREKSTFFVSDPMTNFPAYSSLESRYHPGIFEKITNTIKWSCCGNLAMESQGCQNSYFHVDEVGTMNRPDLVNSQSQLVI